ncbi:MAG: energy-coupling factor transporter transmembrane component T [Eubacteriales bacterium]|nr:energy-coupling factor transporter transmembrane component T [Eubacteriales bacterium]
MIRDITIGQYYPADSLLHRLDPRVKLIGTIVYIASLFIFRSWGYLIGIVMLAGMIALSKVPFKFMVKGLKAVWVLLIFTMALNIFMTPGTAVWSWKFLKITEEGLSMAFKMGMRLVLLIIGASIMTLTTTPNKLTDAMESLFRPLKVIHVPVHEISMMMSIALRFIPILMEETDKIMKAQQARGADFETGSIFRRVKAMVPLLVPLFVSAFRRANDLAMAMEARCYHGGDGRTQMKPLRYATRDYLAYLFLLVYLGATIALRVIMHW